MPYRFQPWLMLLALAVAVALLALIANAQAPAQAPDKIPFSEVVSSITIADDPDLGEMYDIRWDDGRQFHVKSAAMSILRAYPPRHEGGHPTQCKVELVVAGGVQSLVIPPQMLKLLLSDSAKKQTKRIYRFDDSGKLTQDD